MLRQQLRDDHAIRSLNVTIDAQCRECFGGTVRLPRPISIDEWIRAFVLIIEDGGG